VAQYDAMAPADDPRIEEFASRFGIGAEGVRRLTAGVSAATDGTYKLLRDDEGAETVLDLRSGAAASPPPETLGRLRAALEHRPGFAPPGPAAPTETGPSPEELAALERQMKLLGYL
jgi:hypothetical protein